MTEKIFKPPYKVSEAAARGKDFVIPAEVNPEPGDTDTEESGRHMTVQEAGKRGGRATLENHGRDYFSQIGRKGGERTAELHHNLLRQFGQMGGRPKRPTLDETMGE